MSMTSNSIYQCRRLVVRASRGRDGKSAPKRKPRRGDAIPFKSRSQQPSKPELKDQSRRSTQPASKLPKAPTQLAPVTNAEGEQDSGDSSGAGKSIFVQRMTQRRAASSSANQPSRTPDRSLQQPGADQQSSNVSDIPHEQPKTVQASSRFNRFSKDPKRRLTQKSSARAQAKASGRENSDQTWQGLSGNRDESASINTARVGRTPRNYPQPLPSSSVQPRPRAVDGAVFRREAQPSKDEDAALDLSNMSVSDLQELEQDEDEGPEFPASVSPIKPGSRDSGPPEFVILDQPKAAAPIESPSTSPSTEPVFTPPSPQNDDAKNLNPWRQQIAVQSAGSKDSRSSSSSRRQTIQATREDRYPMPRVARSSSQIDEAFDNSRERGYQRRPSPAGELGAGQHQTRASAQEFSAESPVEVPQSRLQNATESSSPQAQAFPQIVREATGSTASFFSDLSLSACGVSDAMVTALEQMGIKRPSNIQAAAIQEFSKPELRHAALADHAGSGKTLAYLIPIIQRLRQAELEAGRRVSHSGRPYAVIVLPTTELCAQVSRVARAISQAGVPFSLASVTGGYKKITQRDRLREGVDIVVGTPGRLNLFLQEGELSLQSCQYVVLDECDILLGDASLFADQVQPLQTAAADFTKFVLVTASLPNHTWMDLQLQFPGVKPLLGPGLHRPAPGSLEQLIDCSGGEEINEETGFQQKFAGLINVILRKPVDRTLIFCNKLTTCRKVENAIKRAKVLQHLTTLPYHTGIEPGIRELNLATFLSENAKEADKKLVLISTDRASRGIDTSNVGHVVLFDFPRDPSEYVRRAGRTARGAGGQGTVSLLVLGRQLQLARQILSKNEKGLPLHGIPIASL